MRIEFALLLVAAGCYAAPSEVEPVQIATRPVSRAEPCDWAPASAGRHEVDLQLCDGSWSDYGPRVLEDDQGTWAVEEIDWSGFDLFSFDTYWADGGSLGGIDGVEDLQSAVAQPVGFQRVVASYGELSVAPSIVNANAAHTTSWLEVVSDGALSARVASARIPAGGTVIAWAQSQGDFPGALVNLNLTVVDSSAQTLLQDQILAFGNAPSDESVGLLVGVTLEGNILVIFRGTPFGGPRMQGRWMNSAGIAGDVFDLGLDLPIVESSMKNLPGDSDELVPLIDGTLALRVAGEWRGVVRSGETQLESAPAWLQVASNLEVQIVAGGRGYAIFDSKIAVAECEHQVQLIDANGQSCGDLAFDTDTSTCGPGTFSLGASGSFFALLPPEDPPPGFGWTALRRWPFVLR